MTDPLVAIVWLIACITAAEMFCEGRERNQFDKQFFSVCMAVFLVAFGIGRWL